MWDICEALTNDLPQRKGVPLPSAMTILYEEAELGWLDPELVSHFALLVVGSDHAMALARTCRIIPEQYGQRRKQS